MHGISMSCTLHVRVCVIMVCYTRTSSCPAKRPLMYVNWTESTLNSLLSWPSAAPAPSPRISWMLSQQNIAKVEGQRSGLWIRFVQFSPSRPLKWVKCVPVSTCTYSSCSFHYYSCLQHLEGDYGRYTWPCAPVLAQYVYSQAQVVRGKRVLEVCGDVTS